MSDESELQQDLAEADTIDAELVVKRGRPPGSKNRSDSRTEIRKRVALHRQRRCELAGAKAEAEIEAAESQERLFRDMRADGLLFFGETAPTINCINIEQETEMARIWAKLLNVRDIQPGENQKAYILEVMQAWCAADCPLLHLQSQTLSKRNVDVPNIEEYVWPENSDEPYQIHTNEVTTNA